MCNTADGNGYPSIALPTTARIELSGPGGLARPSQMPNRATPQSADRALPECGCRVELARRVAAKCTRFAFVHANDMS
jgi:hypothetical protein